MPWQDFRELILSKCTLLFVHSSDFFSTAKCSRDSTSTAEQPQKCCAWSLYPVQCVTPPLIPLVWVHCGDTELEKYCEFEGGETVLSAQHGEVHHWRRAPLQHLCCPYEPGFITMIQSALFCALMSFKQAHLPPPSDLKTYIKHEASNTPTAFNARELSFFFFFAEVLIWCIHAFMGQSRYSSACSTVGFFSEHIDSMEWCFCLGPALLSNKWIKKGLRTVAIISDVLHGIISNCDFPTVSFSGQFFGLTMTWSSSDWLRKSMEKY